MKQNIRIIFSIALASVAFLVRGGDSVYTWQTTVDGITRPNTSGAQDADMLNGVVAYLVDADKLNQQEVLTGVFVNGQELAVVLGAKGAELSSATVQDGLVPTGTRFTHAGEGTDGHAFFVLSTELDNESLLYFSGFSTIKPVAAGEGTLVLNAESSHGDIFRTTEFQGEMRFDGAGGGWYAATVPEPTSGLLVVLGLAALALKRRNGR